MQQRTPAQECLFHTRRGRKAAAIILKKKYGYGQGSLGSSIASSVFSTCRCYQAKSREEIPIYGLIETICPIYGLIKTICKIHTDLCLHLGLRHVEVVLPIRSSREMLAADIPPTNPYDLFTLQHEEAHAVLRGVEQKMPQTPGFSGLSLSSHFPSPPFPQAKASLVMCLPVRESRDLSCNDLGVHWEADAR